MRKIMFLLIFFPVFLSCGNKQVINNSLPENQDALLLAVLWFQKSPEMQAMYYQCYNNATKSLGEKLSSSDNRKPKAVVMDIDETILDNSQVEAYQVIHNVAFSDSLWNRWTDVAIAEPLPGALEFTLYAKSQGVEVFYITNRSKTTANESTLANLRTKGFPFADSQHLILKTTTSLKGERRQEIALKYDILLFIGDNIGDFDSVFDNRDEDLAFGAIIQNKNKFGDSFIILPNPMYGPWINAAIKNSSGNTTREKLLNTIKSF
jgi:5'-nucleotidase (lipoprotein e(P4) family)